MDVGAHVDHQLTPDATCGHPSDPVASSSRCRPPPALLPSPASMLAGAMETYAAARRLPPYLLPPYPSRPGGAGARSHGDQRPPQDHDVHAGVHLQPHQHQGAGDTGPEGSGRRPRPRLQPVWLTHTPSAAWPPRGNKVASYYSFVSKCVGVVSCWRAAGGRGPYAYKQLKCVGHMLEGGWREGRVHNVTRPHSCGYRAWPTCVNETMMMILGQGSRVEGKSVACGAPALDPMRGAVLCRFKGVEGQKAGARRCPCAGRRV